jgi:hypothetical protein
VAVDRRNPAVSHVADAYRWIALRAYGAMRFLDRVQGGLEDVEGAILERQYSVAAFQARHVVLACLSIRSLAREGEIDFDEDSVSFDFLAGLPPGDVASGLALANDALDVDDRTAAEWLDRFRAYVAETERLLGYDRPLPVFRSPDGAFGLLGFTRGWIVVLHELGLPPLLPSEWGLPDARP